MLRKIVQQLRSKITFKRTVKSSLLIIALGIVFGFIANAIVEQRSEFTYNSIADIPSSKTGLLRGTSKYVKSGNINQYYQNRIEAIGFNAKGVSKRYGFKTKIREFFARGKVVLDMIFGVSPKFLGEKIEIS